MSSFLYTWAVFISHGRNMEISSGEILHPSLANYKVGRSIVRFKRERQEEMGKEQEGMRRALSMKLQHWWLWEAL
jgi:hypothetical protein